MSGYGIDSAVKQILNAGRSKGKYITKALAHYVAETLVNPTTGLFYSEENIDDKTVSEVVKKSLEIIEQDQDPGYLTQKMQLSKL